MLTAKPILLSGHSEGARTTYRWPYRDRQVVGAILHNQSCSAGYEHLWQLSPTIPTWQVLERNDPWAPEAAMGSCGHHFAGGNEANFTLLMQDGNNHNPLANKEAQDSLERWLKRIVPGAGSSSTPTTSTCWKPYSAASIRMPSRGERRFRSARKPLGRTVYFDSITQRQRVISRCITQ